MFLNETSKHIVDVSSTRESASSWRQAGGFCDGMVRGREGERRHQLDSENGHPPNEMYLHYPGLDRSE
jgi:hypothetical protein